MLCGKRTYLGFPERLLLEKSTSFGNSFAKKIKFFLQEEKPT